MTNKTAADELGHAIDRLPELGRNPTDTDFWDTQAAHTVLADKKLSTQLRGSERWLEKQSWLPRPLPQSEIFDEQGDTPNSLVVRSIETLAKRKRLPNFVLQTVDEGEQILVFVNDGRLARRWMFVSAPLSQESLVAALAVLLPEKGAVLWPHEAAVSMCRLHLLKTQVHGQGSHALTLPSGTPVVLALTAFAGDVALAKNRRSAMPAAAETPAEHIEVSTLTHLDRLEAESLHIMREVVAQADNPVMLYSVGKDSAVMLHLARKAFYPSPPPFPLMHVDTRWKFQAMYAFRERMAQETGMELIVHINPEGIEKNINPFDHGSALHTDVMKTQSLKQALDQHGFDVAFGGARRDEEKSRAKERVFSFRNEAHRWDPKSQRPELWNLYNGYKRKGESIRVFPLSNWTELDIWQYIYREDIPIVPLYFAAERPVVERDGMLIMVDDERMRLLPGEDIQTRRVRFRTLGCYPLTGAVESSADDLASIVLELLQSRTSERQGRAIDTDSNASMEKKKQEGYF